ncbi:hypothetical protein MCP1_5420001 [Candidatus Terasakiella magnetica]|nr:hypothetical protein MCP1_5420001 [Candidatus Terasakiella magnetica]
MSPQMFVIGFLYYNRYAHQEGAIYTYFIITVRCNRFRFRLQRRPRRALVRYRFSACPHLEDL